MTARARLSLLGLLLALALAPLAKALTCGSDVFIAAAEYGVTSFYPDQIVVADFNGDGLPDMATFGDSYYYQGDISLLLGNPDGTFQTAQTVGTVPEYGIAIAGGPFDAGSTVDLVVSLSDDNLAFFAGNGDGTFQPPVVTAFPDPVLEQNALATGDFNDDVCRRSW